MESEVLVVGGATVDLFLIIDPSNPHFKFDEVSSELSIRLGDKIVFNNATFSVGGNAINAAVGLKKLGIKSSVMAELGNDEFSQKVLNVLQEEGVGVSNLTKGNAPSSFSVILNYKDDRTIFTEKSEKQHDFDFSNKSFSWIYLTSLGEKWEKAYKDVYEFSKKSNAKLIFNPGPSQLDKGISSFSYLFPKTEILIVNKEEAEKLAGGKDINQLLQVLKKMGPKIVVITDGENGSYLISEKEEILSQQSSKVDVISATGTGDAYSSGFLAAYILGKDLQECMKWGTKNAISVMGIIGAQKGLLTKEQLTSDM